MNESFYGIKATQRECAQAEALAKAAVEAVNRVRQGGRELHGLHNSFRHEILRQIIVTSPRYRKSASLSGDTSE